MGPSIAIVPSNRYYPIETYVWAQQPSRRDLLEDAAIKMSTIEYEVFIVFGTCGVLSNSTS